MSVLGQLTTPLIPTCTKFGRYIIDVFGKIYFTNSSMIQTLRDLMNKVAVDERIELAKYVTSLMTQTELYCCGEYLREVWSHDELGTICVDFIMVFINAGCCVYMQDTIIHTVVMEAYQFGDDISKFEKLINAIYDTDKVLKRVIDQLINYNCIPVVSKREHLIKLRKEFSDAPLMVLQSQFDDVCGQLDVVRGDVSAMNALLKSAEIRENILKSTIETLTEDNKKLQIKYDNNVKHIVDVETTVAKLQADHHESCRVSKSQQAIIAALTEGNNQMRTKLNNIKNII